MWVIVIVAVGLALARGGPESRWIARYWFLLFGGFFGLALLWFVVVPRHSLKLARGDRDRQRHILQYVLATPLAGGAKTLARYILALKNAAEGLAISPADVNSTPAPRRPRSARAGNTWPASGSPTSVGPQNSICCRSGFPA